MSITWTPYKFMDADDTLAHAFRNFILGSLHPDDFAKNWVKGAEELICRSLDQTAFPLVVCIDDDLYLIPWKGSPEDDNDPNDFGYLHAPKKIGYAYYTPGSPSR